MAVDGVRAIRRLRPDALVPGILRGLLRRPSLRHEGGVPRDRPRARAPELPQLVPRHLSVRVRQIPDGGRSRREARGAMSDKPRSTILDHRSATIEAEFASDVKRDLAPPPKQLQPKYLYDALGPSLFEA